MTPRPVLTEHHLDAAVDVLATAHHDLSRVHHALCQMDDPPVSPIDVAEVLVRLVRAGRLLRIAGEVDLRLREDVEHDGDFWQVTLEDEEVDRG